MVGSTVYSRSIVLITVLILMFTTLNITPGGGGIELIQIPGTRSIPEGFSVSICDWKDNKSGALSITYDDGLSSHIENASPIMSLLDLHGTFFVTTDNVGIPYGGTWGEWQTVADSGHEIASHSRSHPDLTNLTYPQLYQEVVDTKRSIEENLSNVKCQTFSYPMGLYNETVMDMVRMYYLAARQDRHNITGDPSPVPSSPADMYSIVPVDFGLGDTAAELNDLVDQTISSGDWLVEMIHAVGSGGYDPVDITEFTTHMQHAANSRDDLWIAPFSNVSKYIQVRDSASLNVSHPESYLLDIVLETRLSEALFDLPITLNISFPEDWIDLEVWRRGAPYVYHTRDGGDHRYVMLDIGANERLRIVQANLNPSMEVFNPRSQINVPYYPVEGQSIDVYNFYLNYTSTMNRPPASRPMVWFDLNGDGDLNDIINGFAEGRLNMSKLEMTDIDYTDGCIFFIENWFPPGTHVKIRFSVVDVEGLEGVSSTGMGTWMNGPFLNDPPVLDGELMLVDRHDPLPEFYWDEVEDPDSDPVEYLLKMVHVSQVEIINITTNKTSYKLEHGLEFFEEYQASLQCSDGRGGISDLKKLSFDLTNSPPSPVTGVQVEYVDRLVPVFHVIVTDELDVDGDPVSIRMTLFENTTQPAEAVLVLSQRDNTTFITNFTLKDHTNYEIYANTMDLYGWDGIPFSMNFYTNFPPSPIKGASVNDLDGGEDGLVISWEPNDEDDLQKYVVHRFDSISPPSDLSSADQIYDIFNGTQLTDRNVTDGELYWYMIVGVDQDGEFDLENAILMNGTPVDDLEPGPVNNISVIFQEMDDYFNARMLVEWNASDDGRFLGYRVYRNSEPTLNIENLTPIRYHNGTHNFTSIWDYDIEKNQTYYYTVTAVDIFHNERRSDLTWVSGTYTVAAPPEPPEKEEEESDYSKMRNSIFWASMGAIFLLLIGIIYLSFILMQSRSHDYDEFEE